MKYLVLISSIFTLTACDSFYAMSSWEQPIDPEVRNKVYNECMTRFSDLVKFSKQTITYDQAIDSCRALGENTARYCPTGRVCAIPNTRADVRSILNKSEK